MIALSAETRIGAHDDESDPFTEYASKDLRFKATEHFNDLVQRYRHVIGYHFAEYINTRFCLDGVQASFNYFTPCIGGAKAWQLPLGGYTFSDPPDGSPSEFCPDPLRPPSKKFKFLYVVYDSKGVMYGDKAYPKGELQTLITDLVLDRFYINNRLPYSYTILMKDNPALLECWYFMAVLHLFAENRVMYVDPIR